MTMKTKTLTEWIEAVGYDAAAKILKQKRGTVVAWKLRRRRPRPETSKEIVKRTKGVVTMAGIYG